MAIVDRLEYTLGMDTRKMVKESRKAEDRIKGMSSGMARAIKGLAITAGFAGFTAGVIGLAKSMVGVNAEMERYTVQFKVLHGSVEAAQARLKDLIEFARTTPFELPGVIQASKVLKVFGIDTNEMLRVVGDAAAGASAPIQDIAMWFGRLASGQTGEAIMRLTELGITSRDQLKRIGIQFTKSGQVLSSTTELMTAVVELTKKNFGGMMAEQARTFEGLVSMVKDAWWKIRLTVGEPLFVEAKKRLQEFVSWLDELVASGKLEEWATVTGDAFNRVADSISEAGQRLQFLGDIIATIRDPISFYPTNAEETITWLDKLKERMVWMFDRLPQYYFFRRMVAPFRGEGWDEFVENLEKVNYWLGTMREKVPAKGFIGPKEFIGPLPLPGTAAAPGAPGAGAAAEAAKATKAVDTLFKRWVDAAIKRSKELQEIESNRYQWMWEHEALSKDTYVAFLQEKLAAEETFSSNWVAIQDQIEAVKEEATARDIERDEQEIARVEQKYAILFAAYDTFWSSILDLDMTGAERRKAIFGTMKNAFVRMTGDMLKEHIKSVLIKQKVTATGQKSEIAAMVKGVAIKGALAAKESALALASAAKWIYTGVAKIFSAHAGIPFIGVAIAAGLVATMIAAISKFKSFEKGGFVKAGGIVEPGEFVVPKPIVRVVGVPALEEMGRTRRTPRASAGDTITVTIGDVTIAGKGEPSNQSLLAELKKKMIEGVIEGVRSGKLEF